MVAKKAKQSQPRYVFWFLALFITVFLFVTPFKVALFNGNLLQFENPIYYTIVFGSFALLIIAISLFFSKRSLLDDPLPHLVVWLLPLSLFISSLSPASQPLAMNGVYIYLLLAAMFVLSRYLTAEKFGMMILAYSLIGSGYVIVLFGFMNWFGDASLFGLINWSEVPGKYSNVYRDAVQIDSNGPRMASIFQYANTYAGYLSALLFSTLYVMVTANRKLILAISSMMVVPILLALLLTLSRGGWASALLTFLIILLFIHLHKQILMLIYSFFGLIASVLIYNSMNESGSSLREQFSAMSYSKAWLILTTASVVIMIIALFINKYMQPIIERKLHNLSVRKWVSLIAPFSLILLGVIVGYLLLQDTALNQALPDNLEKRVDNINFNQHSVLERGTFYSDAWKLFKDYPVIGAGSGAWYTLYEEYQNNPYVSRQAHSYVMQHLTETGLLGIFILLGLLVIVFYVFFRRHYSIWTETSNYEHSFSFLLFIIVISLFIHSLLDFDMSYVYISSIFFLCLGALSMNNKPIFKLSTIRWNKVYPLSLAVLSLIMLIGSSQLLKANSLYKEAINKANNARTINDFMDPLNDALDIRPNQLNFILAKSDILSQLYENTKDEAYYTQNLNLMRKAITSEPSSKEHIHRMTQLLLIKNDLSGAYDIINVGYQHSPWYVPFYEAKMSVAVQLAEQSIVQGSLEEAFAYIQDVMSAQNKFITQTKHLTTLPEGQGQGNPFDTTPAIQLALAKANYYQGDYAASTSLLTALLSEELDIQPNREIARWYLAGLRKQGEDDAGLYMRLTTSDSTEIALLEQLLQVELPR